MSKAPSNDDDEQERLILGRAIANLREAKGLSQATAADRATPPMTPQNWGNHETGKVAQLERTNVLRRVAEAIGVTLEDIELERQRVAEGGGSPKSQARLRAVAGGVGEGPARRFETNRRSAVFPLLEGDAVLSFPQDLSPAGYRELADYLSVFLRSQGLEISA